MVTISFSPIKELVIHEIVDMDFNDLMRERVTPAGNMPLYWCNGILFSFSSMPMSRQVTKDYLEGKIHWIEVHYTKKDKFEPIMEMYDEHLSSTIKVRVIDTSKSLLHLEFIKWLKSNQKIK